MLYKKFNAVYLSENMNNEIKISSSNSAIGINFIVYFTNKRDTTITIEDNQVELYNYFEKCFDLIAKKYDECKQNKIKFVDKYNGVITFYSDYCPNDVSHVFILKKFEYEGRKYIVVELKYNKYSKDIVPCVILTNVFGVYDGYAPIMYDLYSKLYSIALEKKASTITENDSNKNIKYKKIKRIFSKK